MSRWRPIALLVAALLAPAASGQSLDDRLDEEAFLRGLIDWDLPELVEHHLRTHPAADAVEATEHRIAALRLVARDPATPPDRRSAAIRERLALRDELLRRDAADPARRAGWAADQAGELWSEAWADGGLGTIALFGLPAPEDRDRAAELARRMDDAARAAEAAIDAAIRAVEADPRLREDESIRARRRRLVEEERDRRIPFLRGVAATIRAEVASADAEEAARGYAEAVAILAPLRERLAGAARDAAALHEAIARIGLDDAETAEAILAELEQAPRLDATTRLLVGLARARAIGRLRGAEAASRALDALEPAAEAAGRLFDRLVIADAGCRASLDAGRPVPAAALARHLALLRDPGPIAPEAIRAIVGRRLARLGGAEVDLARLPAMVAIARAEVVLADGGDPDEAVALLEGVLGRRDLAASEAAAAALLLGDAHRAAGRVPEAVDAWLELARSRPSAAEASEAAMRAALLARRAATRGGDADAIERYAAALDLAIERRDEPRWRYARGRLRLEAGALEEAATDLDAVPADAPEAPDARFMRVEVARRAARRAESAQDGAAAHAARRDQVLRAEAALEVLDATNDAGDRAADLAFYRDRLRAWRAEGLLATTGPAAALDALAGLDVDAGIDRGTLALALRLRVEAHRAGGDAEGVRRAMAGFLEADPAAAPAIVEALLDDLAAEVEALLDAGADAEALEAARAALPIARLADGWLDARGLDERAAPGLRLRVADALRRAGEASEALPRYDRLRAATGDTVESLLGRAESLVALGGEERLAEAMGIYRRLDATAEIGSRLWWTGRLRMLEILDSAGRNLDRIAPEIRRLRLRDPELGGPRFRRGFGRLESRHR